VLVFARPVGACIAAPGGIRAETPGNGHPVHERLPRKRRQEGTLRRPLQLLRNAQKKKGRQIAGPFSLFVLMKGKLRVSFPRHAFNM
jgi:hypothetical protein